METCIEMKDILDVPAHSLCPAVGIRLEDVVKMLRLFPWWCFPGAPEIICLS